jgi:hypothetical protein
MKQDTLSDLTFLNTLKHQIRAVTKALDTTQHVFGQSLEAKSVKHEVTILLSELKVHGLLPELPQDIEKIKQIVKECMEHDPHDMELVQEILAQNGIIVTQGEARRLTQVFDPLNENVQQR